MNETTTKKKHGRPKTIDAALEQRIIDIIKAGGSLHDAADIVCVSRRTVRFHKQKTPDFAERLRKAEKEGKLKLIKKIGSCKAWKAAAWLLEKKYWKEFGHREFIKQDITSGGQPIQPAQVPFDNDRFAELYRQRTGGNRLSPGADSPNRN